EALLIETRDLAISSGDRELLADYQLNDLLVAEGTGDGDRVRGVLADAARLGRTLRQPSQSWYQGMSGVGVAILEGRLADAEGLAPMVRQQGDRPQRWDADV